MTHRTKPSLSFSKKLLHKENRSFFIFVTLAAIWIAFSTFFFQVFLQQTIGKPSNVILIIGGSSLLFLILLWVLFEAWVIKVGQERAFRRIFLLGFLITGIFCILIFVPGSGPDERSHYNAAYAYSDILLGQPIENNEMKIRLTDYELLQSFSFDLNTTSYEMTKAQFHPFNEYAASDDTTVPFSANPYSLAYYPQLRIFATLGFIVGKLLNLSGLFTFYLARLFNLVFFLALAYIAIRISSVAKSLFYALSLLPMTVFICSTLSYDAGIIGMSFVFIAICLELRYSKTPLTTRHIVGLVVLSTLLAPCKLVYFFLIFLVCIIPNQKFSSLRRAIIFKTALVALSALSICIFSLSSLLDVIFGDNSGIPHRGTELHRFHSSSEFLSNPLKIAFIYANTVFQMTDFYLQSFLGGALGTLQNELKAPWSFMLIYLFAILCAAQRNPDDQAIISSKMKFGFAGIFFCCLVFIFASMFLAFTLADEMVIMGVQGKYFLPLSPLLLLIFRLNGYELSIDPTRYLIFGMFTLNQTYMIYIFQAMLRTTG